jgi:hypothetical protein
MHGTAMDRAAAGRRGVIVGPAAELNYLWYSSGRLADRRTAVTAGEVHAASPAP